MNGIILPILIVVIIIAIVLILVSGALKKKNQNKVVKKVENNNENYTSVPVQNNIPQVNGLNSFQGIPEVGDVKINPVQGEVSVPSSVPTVESVPAPSNVSVNVPGSLSVGGMSWKAPDLTLNRRDNVSEQNIVNNVQNGAEANPVTVENVFNTVSNVVPSSTSVEPVNVEVPAVEPVVESVPTEVTPEVEVPSAEEETPVVPVENVEIPVEPVNVEVPAVEPVVESVPTEVTSQETKVEEIPSNTAEIENPVNELVSDQAIPEIPEIENINMAPDLGVVSVPTEENSMPEVSDMTAIPSAPVPVMPEVGTVSTMVKPDLMAPAGTIQNLTAAAPDLMAPNTIGNTTIEKMSAPIGPTRPSELPVQNNIGGKDPISTPEFNPFAQTPMNFVPNNQNNSQE